MKNILFLLSTVILFTISCSDPCDDVNCGANGTCVEGTCECDPGYEGELCDIESRAQYLGVYSGDISPCIEQLGDLGDLGELGGGLTTVNLVVGPDPDNVQNVEIAINNALINSESIVVNPNGQFVIPTITNSFEIPDIPFPITITITGNGSFIDDSTLELNFSIIIPLFPAINCTVVLNK